MFTGLIETKVKIKDIKRNSNDATISYLNPFEETIEEGDSIALNGACLTVSKIENNVLYFQVMNETLKKTNLQNLKQNSIVNLERALKFSDRLAGHIVSGHVDCISKVTDIKNDGFSKKIEFNCDNKYIVEKGSITINGVSLTVVECLNNGFSVSLIPETIKNTNLEFLKIGDIVNIEYDILGKYVYKFLSKNKQSKITLDFLKENGF